MLSNGLLVEFSGMVTVASIKGMQIFFYRDLKGEGNLGVVWF